jgi:heme/copper-type cytochrome/quinol oxidase subunit 3
MLAGSVFYFYGIVNSVFFMRLSILLTMSIMAVWWRDVIREATFEGQHTYFVEKGMRMGMCLFILSEIMFFFCIFMGFFLFKYKPSYGNRKYMASKRY